jgi:hypothetical protein
MNSRKFPWSGFFCPESGNQESGNPNEFQFLWWLPDSFFASYSGGLVVRNLIADWTMRPSTAIGRDQFRRPASRAKTEAQFMGESRLRHPQVVFRFIEKIPNVHGSVSVGREIFARGPKFVGYEANGKQR